MSISVQDDYAIGIDEVDAQDWRRTLASFTDANIYQTWAYHDCCHPRSRVSRLLLRYRGQVVAAAQLRLVVLLGRGIAHLRWGPVWRTREEPANYMHFRRCLDAIVNEYSGRRKLAVEIVPAPSEADGAALEGIFAEAGFSSAKAVKKRTIIMNLESSLDVVHEGLHKKWRNCLNSARRIEQEVIEGDSDEFFDKFRKLYDKMRERKQFETSTSLSGLRALQKRLTAGLFFSNPGPSLAPNK
jgi:hypothetical protein